MISAIIQARTSSQRLPGKIFKKITGKSLIWHLINRLRHSKYLEKIIIATTFKKKDKKIVKFAQKQKLEFYTGSENDVLDRFYKAAKKFNAEIIVRVTSDCPLIDPAVVDLVIQKYLKNKKVADYVANCHPNASFPDGIDVEVFSFKTLEKAWKEAKKPSEREHVTSYIWNNPQKFKLLSVNNYQDFSKLKLSVDYKEDFLLVKKIFEALYKKNKIFTLKEILEFLARNKKILKINQNHKVNEGYFASVICDRKIKEINHDTTSQSEQKNDK